MKNNRRNLIKVLTLGGVSVTSNKIPLKWSRPIVESIVLPAHAQTSETEEDESCSVPLSLPNISNSCTDLSNSVICFQVDDSGECPTVVAGSEGSLGDSYTICLRNLAPAETGDFGSRIQGPWGATGGIQNCSGTPSSDFTNPTNRSFQALSGVNWVANFTVSRTATTVSVTDISLEPE